MEASARRRSDGAPPHPVSREVGPAAAADLRCRVCELEEENARLRLLVSELLVTNQQLREEARQIRATNAAA